MKCASCGNGINKDDLKPYWKKRRPVHEFAANGLYTTDQVHAVLEEENCIYWADHYCKRDGCKRNCTDGDYSCRLRKEDAVHIAEVPRKLRELILDSEGHMLFVEQDDTRFSDEDLHEFDLFVMVERPSMDKAIVVDTNRIGDALITIYPDAMRLMYDPKEFVYDEFPDNAAVGTKVTESVVDYFRNLISPTLDHEHLMQVGSPYDHIEDARTKSLRPIYGTFKRVTTNVWEYRGNCFLGEDIPAERINKETLLEELSLDAIIKIGPAKTLRKVLDVDGDPIWVDEKYGYTEKIICDHDFKVIDKGE